MVLTHVVPGACKVVMVCHWAECSLEGVGVGLLGLGAASLDGVGWGLELLGLEAGVERLSLHGGGHPVPH